ncbi:MAG TPA: long-chain fatty acid--CoA ligase [Dehalococcoidia bacterium]|nr:long-chain fatty acid--CoA ligase [Dehalococcoidia bacterium]
MPRDRLLQALEQRVLAVIHGGAGVPMPDDAFNHLALDVFAIQYARNEPYRRYCELKGAAPATVRDWREVPAVPTAAFKELPLTCFPPDDAELVFTTSGTTQGGRQGTHYLASAKLYNASLLAHFEAALLPDGARPPALVLAQSPAELPHSSLSHMFGAIERELAEDCAYYVDEAGLHADALARDLSLAEAEAKPVMLLGTAFAFVHFLDACAGRGLRWALPKRSRLMDTGGFKGRSREVPRDELYRLYREVFGLQEQYLVNEYGMTELCSQFYDATLIDHEARRRRPLRKLAPPWCRVQALDPETMRPAAEGATGVLRFFDLSNLYSVAAVQTEDLGRTVADGFEVLGRAQGAEARGCSIALDDLLLAQQPRA